MQVRSVSLAGAACLIICNSPTDTVDLPARPGPARARWKAESPNRRIAEALPRDSARFRRDSDNPAAPATPWLQKSPASLLPRPAASLPRPAALPPTPAAHTVTPLQRGLRPSFTTLLCPAAWPGARCEGADFGCGARRGPARPALSPCVERRAPFRAGSVRVPNRCPG